MESASATALFLARLPIAAHTHLHVDLAYIAHSERCALLLDADGVCRWVVPKLDASDTMVAAARRCIGAQYVATLDHDTPGYMGHEPRIGTNLLFALVTDGRVSLARFGPLTAFEELDAASAVAGGEPVQAAEASPEADVALDDEEPMPPTVAAAPELDDLIAVLTPVSDLHLEDAAESEPASDEASELEIEEPSAEAPARGLDETPVAPEVAPEVEARDAEITPVALDSSGDVEIVTGSFARASVRAIEVEDEQPSDLDALDALISRKTVVPSPAEGAMSQATSVDRSLDRIVELTPGTGPDDSQLGIVTAAFARSEELAALLESDLDLTLDTGSFAPASSSDLESDPFMAETERVPRPSGFVMKKAPGSTGDGDPPPDTVHNVTSDDETRRFSRAAGDAVFDEIDWEAATPRRGMLPSR